MPRLAPVTRATAPSILRAFIVSSFLVGLTGLPAVAVVPVMVPSPAHRVRQVLLVPPERRQVEVVVRADQEIQPPGFTQGSSRRCAASSSRRLSNSFSFWRNRLRAVIHSFLETIFG